MRKSNRRQFGATFTIIVITIIVMILSFILNRIGFSATQTTITHNFLESFIVNVNNIFSVEGFRFVVGSFGTNLHYFKPLALLLIALISTSIIESSGIIRKLVEPYKKINSFLLTLIVVFISMVSVFFGEYSFLLLMPVIALIYKELGRAPLLGLLTVFLAITIGFSAGVFINYHDYILGGITERAAIASVDPNYVVGVYSYMYVKILSLFFLTFMLAFLIEKRLTKKIGVVEEVEELEFLENEKKALKLSLLFLLIYIIAIIYLLFPNTFGANLLLDLQEEVYVAQLFSSNSPFNEGAFLLLLLGFATTSYIYGTLTKKYRDAKDFSSGFSKHLAGTGELFVLIFFISQLLAILDWTNLSKVLSLRLVELINTFDFTGAPLIVLVFIITVLVGLLMTPTLEKWEIIAPVSVPIFMKANFTPEFAQIVFRAGDGISKSLTPLFPYYIIMLGFIKKYNDNKPITLFGAIRLMLPIILIMMIVWVLMLLAFYIINIPIGPDNYPTL